MTDLDHLSPKVRGALDEMKPRAIVAVDPGDKHVGIAWWYDSDDTHDKWYAIEEDAKDAVASVEARCVLLQNMGYRVVLVVEEFRLYAHRSRAQSWKTMDTAEMIGALKYVAQGLGIEVVEQQAQIKVAMRAQLPARGIRQVGSGPHARDAELHLLYKKIKEGW